MCTVVGPYFLSVTPVIYVSLHKTIKGLNGYIILKPELPKTNILSYTEGSTSTPWEKSRASLKILTLGVTFESCHPLIRSLMTLSFHPPRRMTFTKYKILKGPKRRWNNSVHYHICHGKDSEITSEDDRIRLVLISDTQVPTYTHTPTPFIHSLSLTRLYTLHYLSFIIYSTKLLFLRK